MPDLSAREIVMMAVCVIVILWLGLYPQTFLRTAKPTVDSLQQLAIPATSTAVPTAVTISSRGMPAEVVPLGGAATNLTSVPSGRAPAEAK